MTEVIPPGDGANPNFLLPTPCHPQGQQREAAGKEGKGSFLGMARAEELTWDTTRFARLCFPLIHCLWRRCPSLPGAGIGIPAALEFLGLWNSRSFGIPAAVAGAGRLRANSGLDPPPLHPPGSDGDGVRALSLDKLPLWSPLLLFFSWFRAKINSRASPGVRDAVLKKVPKWCIAGNR